MDKTLDLTKPVQTRGGSPIRIVCTDVKGAEFNIVALIFRDGKEWVINYREHGRWLGPMNESIYDLVNVPEKKTYSVKLLKSKLTGGVFTSTCPTLHLDQNHYEVLGEHTFEWEE
jgi:hypothetical protein